MGPGALHDGAGPLPVQDLAVVTLGQCLFPHQRAADLRVAGKDGAGKVLVLKHILLEKLGQLVLGVVLPCAHEGELKEADHHRRQGDIAFAVVLQVEDQPALRHRGEFLLQRILGHLQPARQAAGGDEGRRDVRGHRRLVWFEEQAQDLLEHRRIRRAGDVAVQALLEQAVGAWMIDNVTHGPSFGWLGGVR